jgi:predicted ATPase/class 3 adenylate cyclase
LFTDIEGSTRLWEQEPERMRPALARHDAIARAAVEGHRGVIVKMTGDGLHAAFEDPLDAVNATLQLQRSLVDDAGELPLNVRCGLHAGVYERRDNDFFGTAVNRAARIMSTAHGGQMLLSKAVAALVERRLPAGVALRDLGAVRLRDFADPEQLFQLLHPGLRTDFPALRALENTPHNLPHELSSFIGRARELAEAAALMAKNRLVTVLGMGGLGKTRLALQLAAGSLEAFPDGVWFVELAPLSDPRLVAQAVASSLNVKEEAGRPVLEALVKYVKDRALLLVLDNCEHLLQACAGLSKQLLSSAPNLHILTSSREALRIPGETTYLLPPLPVPNLRLPFEPLVLEQFEAAQLFIDRATAARPDFKVTAENATAIAAICHRLDGIPFALELAAARVATLSVENLADRLKDRFKLLKGGNQMGLPRQQTLRALIDWSYDLLSPAEQRLLRELSIFAGGWTLEAAEAVCACEEEDVIDLLGRLVDKSLVVLDSQGGRYHLLETVKQYAQERLDESEAADEVRMRHLTHFMEVAEQARAGLIGQQHGEWFARLDRELENILAAHAWAQGAADRAQPALRMINAIKRYWIGRGVLDLGRRVTTETLAHGGAQQRNLHRCRGLFNAGQLLYLMGQHREARECLAECLGIARELDDPRLVAAALQPLGIALMGEGNLADARKHLEEALILARERGDRRELAAAFNAMGQLERLNRSPEVAEPLYRQVLELGRAVEDPETVAIGLLNLAMVSIERGDGEQARVSLREVLEIMKKTRSMPLAQSLLEVCAGLAVHEGNLARGADFFAAAEALAADTGLRRDVTDEAFLAPRIAQIRATLGDAALAKSAPAARPLTIEEVLGKAEGWVRGE